MTVKKPALRYHGGKFRIAPWVLSLMPAHRIYVEPFGGGAGVLLRKPRVHGEVYNDLDGDVVNFFRVLQDPRLREQLVEACVLTPYAREEFELAWEPHPHPVERARRLVIRAQMGFGSAGATKGQTGFRIDTNRAWSTAQRLWAEYPHQIAAVGERFAGVLIENRPAIKVLTQHDGPDTLHFVDPPYPAHTRERAHTGRSLCYYRHEMTDAEHCELLRVLLELEGIVLVTSYPNPMYAEALSGWERFEKEARVSLGRGGGLKTEVLWRNRPF